MQRIIREGQRFVRRVVSDEEARRGAGRRALQARADRAQGRHGVGKGRRRGRIRRGRRRRADDLRQREPRRRGRLEGPLPRPAPAEHAHDRQRVGPDAHRRRVLAGQREEPAAAAHLRHRVAVEGRAARLPAASGGGRQARSPPTRQGAGPVLLPRGDRLRPVGLAPAGRHRPPGDGAARAAPPPRRRVHLRVHAAHHEEGPLHRVQPPRDLCGGHVPAHPHGRGARRERRDHQVRAWTTTSSP